MVKPLSFKGDKKTKKRKRSDPENSQDSSALIAAAAAAADADDSWVTADGAGDVTGPIVLVLPTTPPTCLACDANGNVFTSEIENMVDGDPATAEPHDVRQVWVANTVAGTEHASFKGHHGRYLSCDRLGILSATREAVSVEESFLCIPSSDTPGTFSIQTQRDTFLSIDDDAKKPGVRGDAETISFNTTLRIRMQAKFKPRLKASKAEKAREKISRKELEGVVGRRLEDHEVRRLKRARKEGDYHEVILDVRVKGKHDKFAS